jgi:hypothetical protein
MNLRPQESRVRVEGPAFVPVQQMDAASFSAGANARIGVAKDVFGIVGAGLRVADTVAGIWEQNARLAAANIGQRLRQELPGFLDAQGNMSPEQLSAWKGRRAEIVDEAKRSYGFATRHQFSRNIDPVLLANDTLVDGIRRKTDQNTAVAAARANVQTKSDLYRADPTAANLAEMDAAMADLGRTEGWYCDARALADFDDDQGKGFVRAGAARLDILDDEEHGKAVSEGRPNVISRTDAGKAREILAGRVDYSAARMSSFRDTVRAGVIVDAMNKGDFVLAKNLLVEMESDRNVNPAVLKDLRDKTREPLAKMAGDAEAVGFLGSLQETDAYFSRFKGMYLSPEALEAIAKKRLALKDLAAGGDIESAAKLKAFETRVALLEEGMEIARSKALSDAFPNMATSDGVRAAMLQFPSDSKEYRALESILATRTRQEAEAVRNLSARPEAKLAQERLFNGIVAMAIPGRHAPSPVEVPLGAGSDAKIQLDFRTVDSALATAQAMGLRDKDLLLKLKAMYSAPSGETLDMACYALRAALYKIPVDNQTGRLKQTKDVQLSALAGDPEMSRWLYDFIWQAQITGLPQAKNLSQADKARYRDFANSYLAQSLAQGGKSRGEFLEKFVKLLSKGKDTSGFTLDSFIREGVALKSHEFKETGDEERDRQKRTYIGRANYAIKESIISDSEKDLVEQYLKDFNNRTRTD